MLFIIPVNLKIYQAIKIKQYFIDKQYLIIIVVPKFKFDGFRRVQYNIY